MENIDIMALKDDRNKEVLDRFIDENQFFIMKCAARVTHRYITKSDDEWSLALAAFIQAIKTYDKSKGSFFNFAKLIIRRRLIDYYRTQSKYNAEVMVDPIVFETDPDVDAEDISIRMAVAEKVAHNESDALKYEIEAANDAFSHFGFSFFELIDCSPKAEKTKLACARATSYILKNPPLLNELYRSRQLPIKIIQKNTKVPRKTLERHRKYIIAAVEILSGSYPYLSEYMQFIRKELDK